MNQLEPKEKAKELVEKFYDLPIIHVTAKDCALIVCEVIIDDALNDWCANAPNINQTIEYWQEVKTEIHLL